VQKRLHTETPTCPGRSVEHIIPLIFGLASLSAFVPGSTAYGQSPLQSTPPRIVIPSVDPGIQQVERRAAGQRALAASWSLFHDFNLTDRREATGITFVHRPPAEATSAYKMVHYDHGSDRATVFV